MSDELRVRTCIQLATESEFYQSQSYANELILCSPVFDIALSFCAQRGKYSSAWEIEAASDVIQMNIQATYPFVNGPHDGHSKILTRLHGANESSEDGTLNIMWTSTLPHTGEFFFPNHFVPLVKVSVSDVASTPIKAKQVKLETIEESMIN